MTAIRILALFNNNTPQNELSYLYKSVLYYCNNKQGTCLVFPGGEKKSLSTLHKSSLLIFQGKKKSRNKIHYFSISTLTTGFCLD